MKERWKPSGFNTSGLQMDEVAIVDAMAQGKILAGATIVGVLAKKRLLVQFMVTFTLYKNAWIDSRPPHKHEKFSGSETVRLLARGGYFVRNTYGFDSTDVTQFWYVIKDKFGGMEELSSKMRNQVKKSLKTYDVERISPDEFRRIALPIYHAAQEAYRVKASLSRQEDIDRLALSKEKDFWAVYTKEEHKPVAVAINTVTRDDTQWHGCCEYNTMKCNPQYQHNSTYPYYGLIYEMNHYYLEEMNLGYVNDGARSLTDHSNVQGFLIDKFHFRRAYCKLQIAYKWYVELAVKILFPFRRLIRKPQVAAILRQEAWARGLEK